MLVNRILPLSSFYHVVEIADRRQFAPFHGLLEQMKERGNFLRRERPDGLDLNRAGFAGGSEP